jgi:hypothetical protein
MQSQLRRLFLDASRTCITQSQMNDELEKIWKEAVGTQSIFIWKDCGGNNDKSQSASRRPSRYSNRALSEYVPRPLPLSQPALLSCLKIQIFLVVITRRLCSASFRTRELCILTRVYLHCCYATAARWADIRELFLGNDSVNTFRC